LALIEGRDRLSDRTDPLPDEIWKEATRQQCRTRACRHDDRDCQNQRPEPPQPRHQAGWGGVDRLRGVGRGVIATAAAVGFRLASNSDAVKANQL
jgi:hypothetical protein